MTAFLCLHNPQETGSCFLGETRHIQIILTDHNTVHVYHLKQKSQYIKQRYYLHKHFYSQISEIQMHNHTEYRICVFDRGPAPNYTFTVIQIMS